MTIEKLTLNNVIDTDNLSITVTVRMDDDGKLKDFDGQLNWKSNSFYPSLEDHEFDLYDDLQKLVEER